MCVCVCVRGFRVLYGFCGFGFCVFDCSRDLEVGCFGSDGRQGSGLEGYWHCKCTVRGFHEPWQGVATV